MSWTEIDLTGVSAEMELVPENTYVFALLPGAKRGKFDPEKIELGAKVTEGEMAGRVLYFSYGNPEKVPAMVGAFKRLEKALARNTGVSIEPGEDPVEYLNNPSVVGGKFIAPVKHRIVPADDSTGREEQPKAEIAIFKVKAVPAA